MKLLDKLERKIGWLAIPNLMYFIIIGNILTYALQMIIDVNMVSALAFDSDKIMQGEVWRIISFILIPPRFFDGTLLGVFFAIIMFLFYFNIGNALERLMGTFGFTIYYLLGMLGVILSGILFRVPLTGEYLNTGLFLAYAFFCPDEFIMLYMVIPIKIKYIAYLSAFGILVSFFLSGWAGKILIASGLLNFLVFFTKPLIQRMFGRQIRKTQMHYHRQKAQQRWGVEPKVYTNPYQKKTKANAKHCCEVCGKTERDDSNLEFRYCSSCEGYHEYCMEHLHQHMHKKAGEA